MAQNRNALVVNIVDTHPNRQLLISAVTSLLTLLGVQPVVGTNAEDVAKTANDPVELSSFKTPVISLAVDKLRRRVLVGTGSAIHIIDFDGKPKISIKSEMKFIHDIVVIPKVGIFAAGGDPAEDGFIEFFDNESFELLKRKRIHDDVVHQVMKIGDRLATCSADSKIKLIALDSFEVVQEFERHSKQVTSMASTLNYSRIVSTGLDDTLRVWSPDDQRIDKTLTHHQDDVFDIKAKPTAAATGSRPLFATVSRDRTVRFWQPTIGRMVRFRKFDQTPTHCCWIPNSDLLLVGFADGGLKTLSSQDLEVRDVGSLGERVYSLAMLNNTTFVAGSQRKLWKGKILAAD